MGKEKKLNGCLFKGCKETAGYGPYIFCRMHWAMLPDSKRSELAGHTNRLRGLMIQAEKKGVEGFMRIDRKALAAWAIEDGFLDLDEVS